MVKAAKKSRAKKHEQNGKAHTPRAKARKPVSGSASQVDPAPALDNSIIKIIPPALSQTAYHGQVGDFLKAVDDYTEASPAGLLMHYLAAVGALVGAGPRVFAGGWQFARLNWAGVGPTNSGRKGTSAVPTDLLMQRVDRKFWCSQRASGLSSGEGLIVKLADGMEKRLLVMEPEFARVLANIRREGNILSAVMREAYDTDNLATLTVKPRHAFGAHINIIAHITPMELRRRLTDLEMANGFGNRFLWFYLASEKLLPQTEPIPESIFQPFEKRLKTLLRLGKQQNVPLPISLDSDAAQLWKEFYPELREDRPGLAGAISARGSSMVLRVALIYCLLERWKAAKVPVEISEEHLNAALAVWDYNVQSVNRLFNGRAGDNLADKLLDLLSDGPQTKDQLNDHLSLQQKENVDATLAEMERTGQVRSEKVRRKGPGRPATRWQRVP